MGSGERNGGKGQGQQEGQVAFDRNLTTKKDASGQFVEKFGLSDTNNAFLRFYGSNPMMQYLLKNNMGATWRNLQSSIFVHLKPIASDVEF
ncbi:MAG: hypothetical protein IPJ82_16685 [Lewinellaceae bacterium]|nr:hypothetical protein [Lewinellaceae bacterium]